LIIDEAQNLSADVLEQLRLLTNLETHERKLLQIILIGQPELRGLLAQPALEQLAQRVIARFHLEALSASETEHYIAHRLAVAGWTGPLPFDSKALRLIHAASRGVPRRINLLCDRALLGTYAQGQKRVSLATVERAAKEVFDQRGAQHPWVVWTRRLAWPVGGALAGMLLVGWWSHGLRVMPGAAVALVDQSAPAAPAAASQAVMAAASWVAGGAASTSASEVAAVEGAASAAVLGESQASSVSEAASAVAAPWTALGSLTLVSDDAAAWRELATLWHAAALEGSPCTALERQGLGCWRGKGNLALLAQLDRPTVLWLEQGTTSGWVLLTGLSPGAVTLVSNGVERQMPLAQLATLWRGDMGTLWRMPDGYRGLLVVGARGPAVDALVALLAQVNQEPAPGGPAQVNPAVMARVSAFQVSEGLTPDGVAGPTTFMLLHRRAGLDEPRLAKVR
jgi:general secretion pathway protein A